MPEPIRTTARIATLMVIGLALTACASTDYLPVRYRLPDAAEALGGRRVVLRVVDNRAQDAIFGAAIREDFRHFTGKFALTVARGEDEGIVTGAFDLLGLFREAMARRLEQAGATVVAADAPVMTVILERFSLDPATKPTGSPRWPTAPSWPGTPVPRPPRTSAAPRSVSGSRAAGMSKRCSETSSAP